MRLSCWFQGRKLNNSELMNSLCEVKAGYLLKVIRSRIREEFSREM